MTEKYTVNVSGTELKIKTDESEEYLKKLVNTLNENINDILLGNTRSTKIEAILICALDYLDDKTKLERENQALRREIDEMKKRLESK